MKKVIIKRKVIYVVIKSYSLIILSSTEKENKYHNKIDVPYPPIMDIVAN